jgi:L-aminopeptidase/D-esterase-like protein
VGCWTDAEHHTGCTVVLPPPGSQGAIAVRGGAPGTREAAALGHTGNVRECHAVVLSGGSAFGLATADGVMRWCVANDIGYDRVVARIPIVGAAIVFDIRDGSAPRPDAQAGWAACAAAAQTDPPQGSVGVGAGCTVGKTAGVQWGSKSGQGLAVVSAGEITVGALMAVNALGDVLDERGEVLAGSRAPASAPRYPLVPMPVGDPAPEPEHTVIGCLVTNARLTKPEAVRAADLAHNGVARAIDPAHTSMDGDALFLLSAQRVDASVDLVAHLGARAVAAAIRSAVRHAAPMPGFPVDPRAT